MFKRSKRRIVVVLMTFSVLLLTGVIGVIYLASYVQATNENRELLKQYVDDYVLLENGAMMFPPDGFHKSPPNGRLRKPPMLELSTFYSVAIDKNGTILKVDTADISTVSDERLTDLALEIVQSGKQTGIIDHLIYRSQDKESYTLVAFLDHTLFLENAKILIEYTLIFGAAALVIVFFSARWFAGKIVAPLEESYQKQRQFISDAGHELKTPVSVVQANLELLSRELGENQWLSNIQYENERMSALILQLLDLARTEHVTPQMEPLDFSRLVCGETLLFETVAYEQGQTLSSNIEQEIQVEGNQVQLKQLVSILLDNAIRHNERNGNIEVILKKDKKYALLSVMNDGEPIAQEHRERLFERFYQTDSARASSGHYGLGLAIAKAITTVHKGTIEVTCHDGKVEFRVKILLKRQSSIFVQS